jgi:hypothetical protein
VTEDELKRVYTEAVKIVQAERKMRLYVFRDRPNVLRAKIAEMDRLLSILMQIKDTLKPHCDDAYEQPALLDVPRREQYG